MTSSGDHHVPRIPRKCISVFQKLFPGMEVLRHSTIGDPLPRTYPADACNHNSASRSRWDTSRWKSCITFVSLTQHRGPAFCIGEKERDKEQPVEVCLSAPVFHSSQPLDDPDALCIEDKINVTLWNRWDIYAVYMRLSQFTRNIAL